MSEQVTPERYKKDLPQLNLDDERDFYIYQLWQEVGAAEAKVADFEATIERMKGALEIADDKLDTAGYTPAGATRSAIRAALSKQVQP
jgi:hypothetical protein